MSQLFRQLSVGRNCSKSVSMHATRERLSGNSTIRVVTSGCMGNAIQITNRHRHHFPQKPVNARNNAGISTIV